MPSSPSEPDRARVGGFVALLGLVALQVYALYLAVPTDDVGLPYVDKFVHIALFATPAALAAAMRLRWFLLGLVLHALISEPLQSLVTTTRNSDVWDTAADLLGIVVGVAVVRQWRRDRPRLRTGARS